MVFLIVSMVIYLYINIIELGTNVNILGIANIKLTTFAVVLLKKPG